MILPSRTEPFKCSPEELNHGGNQVINNIKPKPVGAISETLSHLRDPISNTNSNRVNHEQ